MKKNLIIVAVVAIGFLNVVNANPAPVIPQDTDGLLKYYANDELACDDARLMEQPMGQFTNEDALNRVNSWKDSPRPKLIYDDNGFDYLRGGNGKTPAPGIHPRLLFTTEEIPSIKANLENTQNGRQILEAAKKWEKEFDEGETDKAKFYQTVLNGDFEKIDPKSNAYYIGAFRTRFTSAIYFQALFAMINDDNELGSELAKFGVNYVRLIENEMNLRRKDAADWTFGGPWATEICRPIDVALIYDLCYNWMDKDDRDYIRNLIAKNTAGIYAHGMELPSHWRRWNFVPNFTYFALTALAIEGEKGYDERIYERSCEVMEDYLTYCFTKDGMGTEGMGYCLGNMPNNMEFMWAMLRRGQKNLFAHPHFKEIFHGWILNTLQPNTNVCFTHGDCGSVVEPDWVMLQAMKFFYPEDKTIDYLYQSFCPEKINMDRIADPLITVLTCVDIDENPKGTKVDYNFIPPGNEPLSYFDAHRGDMITRSGWGKDEILFELDGRQDCLMPSHDHSDRGNFILSALGRTWSMDGWRATETKYHSCITIDGWGQGFFATPASWLDYENNDDATFGVIDYKYCFDWMWLKTPVAMYMKGQTPSFEHSWYPEYKAVAQRYMERFPTAVPQRDPLRKVADYYSGYMTGNPLIWGEDTWPERIEHYPVEYAYRSGGLVRGMHNYVLIVDDIKKDRQQRLYEWTMVTPLDVEVVSIDDWDIILGDKEMNRNMTDFDGHGWKRQAGRYIAKKGDAQLLVRVLDCAEPQLLTTKPNPRLETYEIKKHDDSHQFAGRSMDISKRLIIPSRSIAPQFKTLLFPYRYGQQLPTTSWNEDKTILTIEWPGQKDIVTFSKNDTGRTTFSIVRDGKTIVELN